MNIEVKDVSVVLSRKQIVKDASLKIREKEFVGLLGPNGSGKTTLLKSIYRVLKPSSGIVLMDGTDMKTMTYRESARRMGRGQPAQQPELRFHRHGDGAHGPLPP
jgi:iron complex transport system ATP-binding protein